MSAPASPAVRGEAASRIERALFAVGALAGVLGVLKGVAPGFVPGAEFYWLVSYENGFIKRGLVGTLFRPLLKLASWRQLEPLIVTTHVALCFAIVFVCLSLFKQSARRETRVEVRTTLAVGFVLLMCSELMPTLAHDAGYMDVYVVLLVLGGFWLVLAEHHVAAALLGAVGPFVHEAFLFLWAPVAILLLWSCARSKTHVTKKLFAATLPMLSSAAVVLLHNRAAAMLSVNMLPVSPDEKAGLMIYEFGQTLQSSFEHMRRYEFRGHLGNVMTAAAFFLLPSAGLLWSAAFCCWHRSTARSATMIVLVVAAFSPLTILAFAWDLSRYLVWSNLAAAITLIAATSPALGP